jgi:hypothetical protein
VLPPGAVGFLLLDQPRDALLLGGIHFVEEGFLLAGQSGLGGEELASQESRKYGEKNKFHGSKLRCGLLGCQTIQRKPDRSNDTLSGKMFTPRGILAA